MNKEVVQFSGKPDMRIRRNLPVFSHDRTPQYSGFATSNWSAGSRWNGCGSWVDSTTIRGWSCTSDTSGSVSALSIQSPTARSSFSLPYSTSFATSQHEMMLTPKTRSAPSSRRSRCLACSRSGRDTHQTQMWCPAESLQGVPVLAGNRLQRLVELENRTSKPSEHGRG